MNKQLTNLLSGYQDLMDRYGSDDPLVRQMKDEIEQRQMQPAPRPLPLPLPLRLRLRRAPAVRAGEWSAQPRGAARQV